MDKHYKISFVEDDSEISDILTLTLRAQGYQVKAFSTGEALLADICINRPDMILLDLMLPGIQGKEVLKRIREMDDFKNVVIIVVSAKSLSTDKIELLDLGADDYIAKPFDINEFLSRINAHYRRDIKKNLATNTMAVKTYLIDFDNKTIKYNNNLVDLTNTEYKIAEALFMNKNRVVGKGEIADLLYGHTEDEEKIKKEFRTIDMHIKALRDKLKDTDKELIQTIFGVGYRLVG